MHTQYWRGLAYTTNHYSHPTPTPFKFLIGFAQIWKSGLKRVGGNCPPCTAMATPLQSQLWKKLYTVRPSKVIQCQEPSLSAFRDLPLTLHLLFDNWNTVYNETHFIAIGINIQQWQKWIYNTAKLNAVSVVLWIQPLYHCPMRLRILRRASRSCGRSSGESGYISAQWAASATHWISIIIIRVYFRPLKKGVVLPLAIVKKG